jgi:hypothetical protein
MCNCVVQHCVINKYVLTFKWLTTSHIAMLVLLFQKVTIVYECAELCSKECLKVLYIVSCKKVPLHMCNVLVSSLGSDTGHTYSSHSTNSVILFDLIRIQSKQFND